MTVSKSTKDDLIIFGVKKDNISVIHNGVHSIKVASNIKKERTPTLLYLGALASDKGIDNIFKVFNLLHSRHKSWQFWIAGKGSGDYVKIIKSNKHIKYFGFVSEKKKFELLKRAHVFLNLSIREGWGLTNIEANSQGTPVVGFKVAGIKDSVINNKTGILVEKDNLKMLERKIESLILEKEKYSKISNNALKWSKKFTWEDSCKQSLNYLEEVLDSNP